MGPLIVFVDGHNALHVLGVDAGGHEADRGALVADVRSRTRRGVVFFDGHPPPGEFGAYEAKGVRVVFSMSREADDSIVDAVRESAQPGAILVVTDDLELARRAAQLGAKTARVREFFAPRAARATEDSAREREVAHASDAMGLSDAEIAEMERRLTAERRSPGTPRRRPTRRSPRPR
jgi:predicted RNA-binding protein with PIN domain